MSIKLFRQVLLEEVIREEQRQQKKISRANAAAKRQRQRWQQQLQLEEDHKRAARQKIEQIRNELKIEQELRRQVQGQQQLALFNLVLGPSIKEFKESQRRVKLCINALDDLIARAARGSIDGQTFYIAFQAFQDAFKLTSEERRTLISKIKHWIRESSH